MSAKYFTCVARAKVEIASRTTGESQYVRSSISHPKTANLNRDKQPHGQVIQRYIIVRKQVKGASNLSGVFPCP